MNAKRYVVEVWGEEVCRYRRLVTVETPEDATEEEMERLDMIAFEQLPEPPEWHLEESDGIWPCECYDVEVVREAHSSDPTDARLVRNGDGQLVLLTAITDGPPFK